MTLLLALGMLLLAAPAVQAATLTRDATNRLTYTSAPGANSFVSFDEDDATPGTVRVTTSGDPIVAPPAGCTATPEDDGDTYVCTGVTAITAIGGDGNDDLWGYQLLTIPFTADGGTGNDDVEGGNQNDVLTGGDGDDYVSGDYAGCCTGFGATGGNDIVDGGAGEDYVTGGAGNDTVTGGAGDDDEVAGGPGDDQVSGGDGDDEDVKGGPGNDTVNGDAGNDEVAGGCSGLCGSGPGSGPGRVDGNDTVNGGDGDDYLVGDQGNDTVNGGNGEDYLDAAGSYYDFTDTTGSSRDPGDDVWNGGDGIDQIVYSSYGYNETVGDDYAIDVRISQDGQANDGQTGENDNVSADIEDINVYSTCCTSTGENIGGVVTIAAGPNFNSVSTGGANDTVDAGANNDFIFTGAGNDTINARDGFADRIDCGETFNNFTGAQVADNDVANVDQFDIVASNCETVNRVGTPNANEDPPPTISWTSPATGSKMSTTKSTTLTVATSPDTTQVVFLDDDRIVCTDTTAPFTCDYKPRGDDVGRNTLVAIAYDANQQTATAVRTVVVPRFRPRVTGKTTPKSDSSSPYTFTTSGRVVRPSGVSAALGCRGKVAIQIKAGKKTISTRRAKVRKNCRYSNKVTFDVPARLTTSKLNVTVRFGGNAVLGARTKKKHFVNVD